MRSLAPITLCLLVCCTSAAYSQAPKKRSRAYPPQFPEAKTEVYKTIGDVKLNAYVFTPAGHKPGDRRAAVVFFFGGGWRSGSPAQFYEQCKHLAGRGLVAITADYRVSSRHGVKAVQCVADGKSAIRWVRENADRLGVDPNRVVAAGGSAGGHVAACTGVISGLDEPGEDTSVSSRPNALVLFNPALVLAPAKGAPAAIAERQKEFTERMGTDPVNISPLHHVKSDAPPTLILHGKADTTVPYVTAELFAQAMRKAGARCELIGYDGQKHGFFNFGRGDGAAYKQTVADMDTFLVSLGYLPNPKKATAGSKPLGE